MKRIATLTAGLALSLGSLAVASPAVADETTTEPCAKQTAQVEKATEALAKVTAVFERQQTKVKAARGEVRSAETGSEKAKEKKQLAKAKAKKNVAKKAKKAQVQRLAKAEQRLATCEAGGTETPEEPTTEG